MQNRAIPLRNFLRWPHDVVYDRIGSLEATGDFHWLCVQPDFAHNRASAGCSRSFLIAGCDRKELEGDNDLFTFAFPIFSLKNGYRGSFNAQHCCLSSNGRRLDAVPCCTMSSSRQQLPECFSQCAPLTLSQRAKFVALRFTH